MMAMFWKQWRNSLYFLMIFILLVMALLPLLTVSVVGYTFFSRSMLDMVTESNFETLEQVQYKLTQIRADIDDILVKTSGHSAIQEILREKAESEWEAYRHARFFAEYTQLLMIGNQEIYKISIMDLQGRSFDSLGRFLPNNQISEPGVYREMLRQLMNGDTLTAISGIYETHHGIHLISFGKIVLNLQTGKPLGMVVVDLNLRILKNELNQVGLLNSGKVILVNQENRVIFHPALPTGSYLNTDWTRESSMRFFVKEKENGEVFLYLRSRLKDMNWNLYGMIPYEEVLDQTSSIRKPFIFL